MDKRTLLAVILSVIVISVGFYIQSKYFMPPVEEVTSRQGGAEAGGSAVDGDQTSGAGSTAADSGSAGETVGTQDGGSGEARTQSAQEVGSGEEGEKADKIALAPSASSNISPYGDDPPAQKVRVENAVFDITFSSKGAVATSIKLKEHLNEGEPLEMVQNDPTDLGAFGITFGEPFEGYTNANFHVRRVDDLTVEFYRDFAVPSVEGDPVPFTLKKRFIFKPDDYMMELRISVENSVNAYPPLDFNGYAYTLGYGPEIGPKVESLDGRYSYRRFYSYAEGDRDRHRISGTEKITDRVVWMAMLGKYFTVIGIPDATKYDITLSERAIQGMDFSHQLFFSRPKIKSSVNEDVFQFYIGPKLNRVLTDYNDVDRNGFNVSDLHLEEVVDTGWSILGWLEWILKKMMMFFHSLVPNWGVAIVMLTIAIKLVLFPITHKSYESTSKMQALNPKIQEIRSQYKDNPQKMNQEMANLYKTEGVNPLGGCLPLLLQMPIFIALFGLLNKHFDLRGATFIEGWISDLSSPESILSLPFQIPILGWSDVRLLPILFATTMFFSSKMMQQPGSSSQGNMKMVMYLMPFFLFFVLYNAPSGLLVYWIITNFLTVIQQKVIGKRRQSHEAAAAVAGGGSGSAGTGPTGAASSDSGESPASGKIASKASSSKIAPEDSSKSNKKSSNSDKSGSEKQGKKGSKNSKSGSSEKKSTWDKAKEAARKRAKSSGSGGSKTSGKSKSKGGGKPKSSAVKESARRYSIPKQNRTKKKKKR